MKENEDYKEDWEELSEKEIMMSQLIELQQIRLSLQGGETESESMYECKKCKEVVPQGDRKSHAEGKHNAPTPMVNDLFEEVA